MDLKTFIRETIVSIVEGVVDAQAAVADKGAFVNPGGLMRTVKNIGENALWNNKDNNLARDVAFDVALTVEEGTQMQAKIGVLSGIVGAGAGGQTDARNLVVSRVSFVVPVLLPATMVEGARIQSGKMLR